MAFPSVRAAVRQRRTVYHFRPEPLPDELIDDLLETASCVPNHKHTQPWRFAVVRGQALARLGDIRVELQRQRAAADGKPLGDLDAVRSEVTDAAVAVYVLQVEAEDPKRRQEDYASCAIAAYILQLAAWEQGVGARWNTGQITRGDAVRAFLGLEASEAVVCCLLLGRPADLPPGWRRREAREITRYIE